MALIDRIKYDGPQDVLVWRYPKDNITMGAQLIVHESQEALFFKGGEIFDVFPAGTYTLSTNNLPGLQKIVNLPFGTNTPFSAEVYYVNRVARLDYKWGTKTPIPIEDPKYGVLLSVGCHGQFGLRVADSRTLVTQLVGTLSSHDHWDGEKVLDYFRGLILTRVKDAIAKVVLQKAISVTSITAYIDELSQVVEYRLRDEFAKYGLELLKFFITGINIPDEEVAKIQKGGFERLEVEQLGDARYQMIKNVEIMQLAAKNPGMIGTLMGGGIGLGLGSQMSGAFVQAAQITKGPTQVAPSEQLPALSAPVVAPSTLSCSACGATNTVGGMFCTACGTPLSKACPECNKANSVDSRFCSSCGKALLTLNQ